MGCFNELWVLDLWYLKTVHLRVPLPARPPLGLGHFGCALGPPNIERPQNMRAIRFYLFIIVGIKDPEMGIGPWAMSKDIKSSKDK